MAQIITFSVSEDGKISPSTVQKAGVQGNHNITEVRFNVEEALVSGALEESPTSRIRMQFIDGAGGFYSTGFLDVMAEILPDESAQYFVTCPIPSTVTNAGGIAKVYLVVTKIVYGVEDGLAYEDQVFISSEARISFEGSGVGSPSEYQYRKGISSALVNAEIFVGQAENASDAAKEYRDSAKTFCNEAGNYQSKAGMYASNAETSENNAKGFKSAAAESAEKAQESENRASTSANNAETSETNARTSATNASQSANTAESSATAAREASDLAKKYRDETADMFENFNGIQLWQPNTEYKVGDIVLATWKNEDKKETVIAECNEAHTSSSSFTNDLIIYAVWDMNFINARGDEYGRSIYETYATKEDLAEAIGLALEGDY